MEKFKAAIFDNLSYWLEFINENRLIITKICNILSKCILPNGIVCIKSYQLYEDDTSHSEAYIAFQSDLKTHGFQIIGTIGIKNKDEDKDEDDFYTLYSKNSNTKSFSDWTGINTQKKTRMPYLDENMINPEFQYIIEFDLFDFINNRIISIDSQNKNNKFIEDKKRNIKLLGTQIEENDEFSPKLLYAYIQQMPLDIQQLMLQELLPYMSQEEQLEILQIDAEAKKADKSLDKVRDRNTICIPNPYGKYLTHTDCKNAK